ncbi:MAG: hypothetical protein EP343_01350 [Deltaproteobacteria bacterium]|nr:MAG: hypothetical protein EP343_01350 [Deltaproteobacteria bacterium]
MRMWCLQARATNVLRWALLSLFVGIGLFWSSNAQADRFKFRWGGEIGSSLFIGLQPSTSFIRENNLGTLFNYRNTNHITLKLNPRFGRQIAAKANIELRNLNFSPGMALTDQPDVLGKPSSDLEDYNRVLPVSVRVNELYVDFYGIIPNVDMRIGQQRIAWGTATVFNPTDNLNPYNLENPIDFQQRLGVPAIKFDITAGEHVTISLIDVFMFTPPVLPITLFRQATTIDTSVLVPDGFRLGTINSTETVELPLFDVTNMIPAAKIAVNLDVINFSASYIYGRLYIPAPKSVPITGVSINTGEQNIAITQGANPDALKLVSCLNTDRTTPCEVNASAEDVRLVFPRVHIVGLDFSTSLGGVGFWAEAALFIPTEAVDTKFTLPQFLLDGMVIIDPNLPNKIAQPLRTFKDQPYIKITAGMDYTFPGGWYFNLQYLYGFFNEQSWDELHHYAILAFRKGFLRDKLLIQLSAGIEIDSQRTQREKDLDGNEVGLGFIINPEIHYKPADSATIILGGIITRGHEGTTLRLFQALTQVYLRAKFTFGG